MKNETSFETKGLQKAGTDYKKLANEEGISVQEDMDLTHKSITTVWRYMQIWG